MMRIFDEELLIEHIFDYEVVLVGMGINNSFSNGLPSYIKVHFPKVRTLENVLSPYGDRRKYGTCLPIKDNGIEFVMCYIHDGGYRKKSENVFVDYDALTNCLYAVAEKYKGKKIATTLMGGFSYDGNGDTEKLKEIFETAFKDADVSIYTRDQGNFDETVRKMLVAEYNLYKSGKESRETYLGNKNRLVWLRKNGIFKPVPEGFTTKKTFSWEDVITVKKTDL